MHSESNLSIGASFHPKKSLKENESLHNYSSNDKPFPFVYAGKQLNSEKSMVNIYGFVETNGTQLPVVKSLRVHLLCDEEDEDVMDVWEGKKLNTKRQFIHRLFHFSQRVLTGKKNSLKSSLDTDFNVKNGKKKYELVPRIQFMSSKQVEARRQAYSKPLSWISKLKRLIKEPKIKKTPLSMDKEENLGVTLARMQYERRVAFQEKWQEWCQWDKFWDSMELTTPPLTNTSSSLSSSSRTIENKPGNNNASIFSSKKIFTFKLFETNFKKLFCIAGY